MKVENKPASSGLTLSDVLPAGVIDDRGKFISITPAELDSVAQFIRQRGRVSISELAQASNSLINLTPKSSSAAWRTQGGKSHRGQMECATTLAHSIKPESKWTDWPLWRGKENCHFPSLAAQIVWHPVKISAIGNKMLNEKIAADFILQILQIQSVQSNLLHVLLLPLWMFSACL